MTSPAILPRPLEPEIGAALLRALRLRDPELHDHASGVAERSVAVARRLGLDAAAAGEVGRAAELHDIGKVAIPTEILQKPAPLDGREWKVMRRHTIIGERMLLGVPGLREVARIVRSSHERWDGGGYPDGLAGEEIPLGARIVAVCDSFDAMTSDRPYRRGMSHPEGLAEVRRNSGTQFDPAVVEAFLDLFGARAAGSRLARTPA